MGFLSFLRSAAIVVVACVAATGCEQRKSCRPNTAFVEVPCPAGLSGETSATFDVRHGSEAASKTVTTTCPGSFSLEVRLANYQSGDPFKVTVSIVANGASYTRTLGDALAPACTRLTGSDDWGQQTTTDAGTSDGRVDRDGRADNDGSRDGASGTAGPCTDGTYDDDGDPQTACVPWSECEAGSYVTAAGTATTDRTCAACASGTFTGTANATACAPWKICPIGQFIKAPGSSKADQTCEPCPTGQYNTAVNSSVCVDNGTCAPGTEPASAGATPVNCVSCPAGTYCAGGLSARKVCDGEQWDHDGNAASACVARSVCDAGQFESAAGTATSDRTCSACGPGSFNTATNAKSCKPWTDCPAGQFVSTPGTAARDRACTPCAAGTFSAKEAGANARACVAWGDCQPGQSVVTPGTADTDRVCTGCSSGLFSTTINAAACSAWRDCPAGQFVKNVPSASTDRVCEACAAGTSTTQSNQSMCLEQGDCAVGTERVTAPGGAVTCAPCPAGTYCAGGMAPKQACTGETWDNDGAATTICVAKAVCGAGQYQVSAGNATTNRVCAACASETFSSTQNATACTAWKSCKAGEQISANGTSTSDRACAPCAAGRFSSAVNSASCAAWRSCSPGQYLVTAGTASSDVTCAACASGQFSTADNAASCAAWKDCTQGQYVTNTPSATTDRLCAACEAGKYTTQPNQSMCLAQGACAAGTKQTAPGTPTSPPTCVACLAGTYCAGGTNAEQACAAGTWDHDASAVTPCVAKDNCNPGERVQSEGSATTNRSCAVCGAGQFSTTANAATCSTWRTCTAGQYVTAAGTVSSDRNCADCAAGFFSSNANASSCQAWKVCPLGQYVSVAASPSQDRTCVPCQAGRTTSTQNSTSCSVYAVQVVSGDYHTCILLSDGNVRCWGFGGLGQLGYGVTDSVGADPVRAGNVNIGGTATQIVASRMHTCVLLTTGKVRCWGLNNDGQLGYAKTTNVGDAAGQMPPANVDVGGSVVQVSVGGRHTCARLTGGTVRCWGYAYNSELGYAGNFIIGDNETPATAGDVEVGGVVAQVGLGGSHSCVVLSDNNARCWGFGGWGELGYGNTNSVGYKPQNAGNITVVAGGGGVSRITGGDVHTCAILATGKLRCWGKGEWGRLGYGNTNDIGDNETPASAGDVPVGGNVVDVAGALDHTCAVLTDGQVRCWGRNLNGVLGISRADDIGDNETPASVPSVVY